jgi:hypothetical protein
MESPLPDEERDADGDFKNVNVRKSKESTPPRDENSRKHDKHA